MTAATRHSSRPSEGQGSPPGARAFTLIEIMLVVGIMGIVLAMGLPSIVRALDRQPLQQAVSDVVEALSHGRAQAILRGVPCETVIQGDGQVFARVVSREVPPGAFRGEGGGGARLPEGAGAGSQEPLFHATLGADIMIVSVRVNLGRNLLEQADAGEARVRFFPNGTCDDFELILQDATGIRRIVTDPVTGFSDVVTER